MGGMGKSWRITVESGEPQGNVPVRFEKDTCIYVSSGHDGTKWDIRRATRGFREYGSTAKDVLSLDDNVAVPEVAPDEVLVKVKAASINPIEFQRYRGEGFIKSRDSALPHVPGYDFAGVVVKLGSNAKVLKEGDEVYGDVNESSVVKPKKFGTLAQYVAVKERLVALKPKNLTFVEAAGVPVAFLTAQQALNVSGFKPGQTALILNGAGGVGTAAIQLAKHVYGASFVAATASTNKLDLLKSLGADLPIDYTKEIYWELPQKFDFVLDGVGDRENAGKALKDRGVGIGIVNLANLAPKFRAVSLVPSGSNLTKLNAEFEKNTIKPVQDPTSPYKFTEVVEALTYLEKGRAVGKISIQVDD